MTDITVAQAAIIEDHVWALMEALGVRDSRAINQRVSEAIGTVLDRQRDALPAAKCKGELKIGDLRQPCNLPPLHPGLCSFFSAEADHLPWKISVDQEGPDQPTKCTGALNIRGEHFPCDLIAPHLGMACSSKGAEAIWQQVAQ